MPTIKKPFMIFEAGSGKVPIPLLRKSLKATRKRKEIKFTGVDEKLNLDLLLRKTRLKTQPKNLRLVQNCAIKELLKIPKESQHVIFGSYLVNNLGETSSCTVPQLPCNRAFFVAAERALRPGGRIILVQDKNSIPLMKEAGHNLGFDLHMIAISDERAKKSKSWAIRKRSTPEKRVEYLQKHYPKKENISRVIDSSRKYGINSLEELARPTIFILRRPRKTTRDTPQVKEIDLFNLLDQLFRERM